MKVLALALSFAVLLMSAFYVVPTTLSATESMEISVTATGFEIAPDGTPVEPACEDCVDNGMAGSLKE